MKPRLHGTERVVRFGADDALVGIVTEAVRDRDRVAERPRPAVIFLNSGILHRVGSCRFHVRVARALSAAGFDCLRFDFSGIGDSEQRRDALPFETSAVIETRDAMDRMHRLTGASQFVLVGLCSGADMAHETALVDDRVVGLHLIDAWTYRTMGFYFHHYAPRLLRPSVWWNALRVRVGALRRAFTARAAKASATAGEYEMPTYTRVFPPRERIAANLRALVARGVQLRMLWTSGLPDHNHKGQYAACFRDVPFGAALEEDHLPSADHILTGLEDQEIVTQRATTWTLRHWPASIAAPAPQQDRAPSLSTSEYRMPRFTVLSLCLLSLLSTACSTDGVSTAPVSREATSFAELVGDQNNEFTIVPGVVNVCAFFPTSAGVDVANATFTATGPAGQGILSGPQTLTPVPHCVEVWNAVGASTVNITATLNGFTSGYVLERVVRTTGDAAGSEWTASLYDVTSATVSVNQVIGGAIWFKFRSPDGSLGGQGCTPGYWKQPRHADSWPAPYTRSTLFGSVFANAFPGKTFAQVLALRGGGLNALGRHTVAALLNAASAGVEYDLTVAQVIAAFNAAYLTAHRPTILDQKNVFDMLNNQGCPLN